MNLQRVIVVGVALLGAQGCAMLSLDGYGAEGESDGWSWSEPRPSPPTESAEGWGPDGHGGEAVGVQVAHLQGQMGDVRDIDGEADQVEAVRFGTTLMITLHVPTSTGVAMAALAIDEARAEGDPAQDWLVGCSGPQRHAWTFDRSVQGTIVKVAAREPGVARYEIDADFGAEDGRVRGVIEVGEAGSLAVAAEPPAASVRSAAVSGVLPSGQVAVALPVAVREQRYPTHSVWIGVLDDAGTEVDVVLLLWGGLGNPAFAPGSAYQSSIAADEALASLTMQVRDEAGARLLPAEDVQLQRSSPEASDRDILTVTSLLEGKPLQLDFYLD